MDYIKAHRRPRALQAYSLGVTAAKPVIADKKNRRCQYRIALYDGEVDFRYHPCEEFIIKTCLAQGMNSEEIAKVLDRYEGDVIVILADLLLRGVIQSEHLRAG